MISEEKFHKPIFDSKEQLKALKYLNKSLGLNKLRSEKLHRRAIKIAAAGALVGGVYFYTPLHFLYYYKMSMGVTNLLNNAPLDFNPEVYDWAISALDYAVPVSAGILLASAVYCKWASRDSVKYEKHLKGKEIIKKGAFDKDKYLHRGEKALEEMFNEASSLSSAQKDEVLFSYVKRYVEDRAAVKRRKPKKKARLREFLDMENDVLAYKGFANYEDEPKALAPEPQAPSKSLDKVATPPSEERHDIDFRANPGEVEAPKDNFSYDSIENVSVSFDEEPSQKEKPKKRASEGIFLDEEYTK